MAGEEKHGEALVFTPRDDVRDVIRTELGALGVAKVKFPGDKEDCVAQLISFPSMLLVLDWALGAVPCNQILEAVRAHFKIEIRPIFLLIPEVDANIVATGAEYGVSQMHVGPVSRLNIREGLAALLREDASTRLIRDTMVEVAMLRSRDQWEAATPLLLELLGRFPKEDRVACELADNIIHLGQWDRALEQLQPLIEDDPPNVRALHLMGRCHLQLGELAKATNMLSRAKLINPHNVERLIDLGNVLLKSNKVGEARENFDAALAIDADNAEATAGVGTTMLLAGEVNEALALMKNVSGPRELASVFNTAAILTIRQGQYNQGMQLYRAAIKALGRNDQIAARLMFNMGLGYRRWGKNDKALLCFDRSLALDPGFAKVLRHKEAIGRGQEGETDVDLDIHEFSLSAKKEG